MANSVAFNVAVEGDVDAAAARRVLESCGATVNLSIPTRGKGNLDPKIRSYAAASRRHPWLVLRDLDQDGCPVDLAKRLVPAEAPPLFCFRIVVRSVEAWLLADSEAMAQSLGVRVGAIPSDPEALPDAKRAIVDLARKSRRREIREMLVPRDGAGRTVGPEYSSFVACFAERSWRVEVAEARAASLARTRRRLCEIAGHWQRLADDPTTP